MKISGTRKDIAERFASGLEHTAGTLVRPSLTARLEEKQAVLAAESAAVSKALKAVKDNPSLEVTIEALLRMFEGGS